MSSHSGSGRVDLGLSTMLILKLSTLELTSSHSRTGMFDLLSEPLILKLWTLNSTSLVK